MAWFDNNKRLVCPNCGSTAQVKFVDYVDDFCGSIQTHYHCGCGAKFHITYHASNAIYIDELPKKTNLSPLAIRMINKINKDRKGSE